MNLSNVVIAAVFDRTADLLELQSANEYRIRAYRRAAHMLRQLDRPAVDILEQEGEDALVALPTIGTALASSVDELLHSGSLRLLERLEGRHSPEELFESLPGIGDELAHRIHEELAIDTLEELEVAAFDGRLDAIEGIGEHRLARVREYLAKTLGRSRGSRARDRRLSTTEHGPAAHFDHEAVPLPSIAEVLALDAEYQKLVAEGRLHRIAPARLNPRGEKWLPVWHPDRFGYHWTVLYSNSALAHRLGKTRDWVVLYFEHDGQEEQCTVVTEYRGDLSGRRVVRGRESACRAYYAEQKVDEDVREWAHERAESLTDDSD